MKRGGDPGSGGDTPVRSDGYSCLVRWDVYSLIHLVSVQWGRSRCGLVGQGPVRWSTAVYVVDRVSSSRVESGLLVFVSKYPLTTLPLIKNSVI